MQTIADKIISRIYGHGRGWVFSAKDFADLGSRGTVDKTLTILRDRGTTRQVARGLYDYPRVSKALQMQAPPDTDQVAQAVARKRGWRIQACGPWAANLVGLSTQVPARPIYLTDGKRASIDVGNMRIDFRPTALKDLDTGRCGLVLQALRGIGKERVDDRVVEHIRQHLSAKDRRKLIANRHTTGWIYEVVRRICLPEED